MGVPDEFAPPTFKLQQIVNMTMPIDENANFACIVRPTCRRTVGVALSTTADRYNILNLQFDPGIGSDQISVSSVNPVHQQDLSSEKLSPQVASTYIAPSASVPLVGCNPVGLVGANAYPNYYDGPSTGYLIAYDANSTNGSSGSFDATNDVAITSTLSYASNTAHPLVGDITFGFACYDSSFNLLGVGGIACNAAAIPPTGAIVAGLNCSQEDIFIACGSHTTTAWWVITGVQNTASGVSFRVSGVEGWLQQSNPAGFSFPSTMPSPVVSQWTDCPDAPTMCADFQNIRPVSMSVWANYRGNVLENDSIAAKLVYTNLQPMDQTNAITSYPFLSKSPDSYNGPLNTGAYVLWRPTTFDQATKWTSPYDGEWYRQPVASISGHMPSGGVVNLRVVINFEAQTNETLFATTPTIYSPEYMVEAFRALAHFPSSMENASHAERIRNFLFGVAKGVYNARVPLISSIAGATGNPGVGAGLGALAAALPNWK